MSTRTAIPAPHARRANPFGDVWVVARRALIHMRRQPEALADVTLQPVMFVLLFAYVFGGAIQVADGGYREFLMGGIFAQTITFGVFGVALALSYDRKPTAPSTGSAPCPWRAAPCWAVTRSRASSGARSPSCSCRSAG